MEIQSIENNLFPITLEMDTPSRSISLTIDQVVRINDTLYVLSKLHRPEFGDCATGHATAKTSYTIPEGATHLKVKHFVLGHNWNWGKSDDIAYLENEKIFTYIVKVLENPQFQRDPQGYLSAWKERRGCTEEWRVVEDGARLFFDQHFPTL